MGVSINNTEYVVQRKLKSFYCRVQRPPSCFADDRIRIVKLMYGFSSHQTFDSWGPIFIDQRVLSCLLTSLMIAFATQGGRDLHRPPCPPIWHVPRTPSSFMNYAYYALKSLYLSIVLQAGQGLSKQQVISDFKMPI